MTKCKYLLSFIIYILPLILTAQINNAGRKIAKKEAIGDLEQFERILKVESSYFGMKPFDLDEKLNKLKIQLQDSVEVSELGVELEKIMGEVGDRHSSITNFEFDDRLFLPFIVAPLSGKLVALKKNKDRNYLLLYDKYPYLKSINDIPIDQLIQGASFRQKHAPPEAKLAYAARDMMRIEFFFHKAGIRVSPKMKFTFSDGSKEIHKTLKLQDSKMEPWQDLTDKWHYIKGMSDGEMDNDTLFQMIDGEIGYFRIPRMWGFNQNPDLFPLIKRKMEEFKNTKSLILDVRNNGGGQRDILMTLAPYFRSPESKPWIANLAKVRSDQFLDEDINSMLSRYLYNYHSTKLDDADRSSIDEFIKDFESSWNYNPKKYSEPFFMVLKNRKEDEAYFYNKPVYVLANERSFSAASVFVTALKGMGNVKIAGLPTDGSSGRSRRVPLGNSNLIVRYSTMISLQRNGKTLDTNGTEPDIYLMPDMEQVLGHKDSQLERLMEIIKNDD